MQLGESTQVGLLGAVSVRRDGVLTPVPGGRARTVLAALALDPGRFRSAAGLIEDIWGETAPRDPMNALHTQISRLRAVLPEGAIEAGPAGYRLALGRAAVDLATAQDQVVQAEAAHRAGKHEAALDLLEDSARLWRGEAGADLADAELAAQLRAVVAGLRQRLDGLLVEARLSAGRYAEALPSLAERCELDPVDEHAHGQLMRCLCALGRSNEAIALFATLRERLAERLGVDPSDELARLHLQILRGELAPRPAGLRSGPNPLLGREADIARLGDLLDSSRVVTILGPGGMGKTRIANELGLAAAAGRAVTLVELVGVRSGADVPGAVTAALGLSEVEIAPDSILRGRGRDARAVLRSALAVRPTLLILDNCEHVVEDCADLAAELIAWCPELTVLTTSRTPLQIAGEAAYPLPPLLIKESGSPATDLFIARATAVRPSVRLDPAAVAQLCHTLDGLPLAIELAAARVRTMSVEQINERLTDRFTLLRGTDRTSPDRHRTLHAVIDWSWDLLAEPERAALRRLSGFPGGFTRSAAAAVVGGAGALDVDAALEGLVNQSLLEVTESPAPVGIRYHMLETVREYGQERLAASPAEAAEVARLRAQWAAGHAAELFEALTCGDQVSAMARTESEHENLLDMLRWTVEGGQTALALPLYSVLGLYWSVRGAHSEAGSWAHRVLEISGRPTAFADAEPAFVLASQIIVAGYLYVSEDLRGAMRARGVVRRVLRADAAAATSTISPSMRLLGEVLLSGNGSGGVVLGRLLARGVRSPDLAERCLAHVLRANSQENAGNRRAARRDTERALDLARQRGDRWAEGMASQMLGQLSSQVGHYEESVGHYRSAGAILWELRAYEESAQVRGVTAAALVGAGRPREGRAEALAALEVSAVLPSGTAAGERRGSEYEAAVTGALAEADLAEGLVDSGLERYRRAVGLCRDEDGGNFVGPYAVLITSAAVCAHVDAGRLSEARDMLGEMLGSEHGATEAQRQYVDVPIMGAMLMATAAVEIASGAARAARALGLAVALGSRQDYPALRHERWMAAARLALGDEVVDAELRRAAGLPRRVALAEVGRELDRCRQALRM
ncbi:BTAD domain-containing putative transcriptional regulator [Tomitella biformata]|uniref:BTAD domain-containing putative transcriptional regulator n=1 Tax=Tomitella biformata TaxID=630403 RepID=UPI0004668ADD|nr:BTAD domain-containing putative transcriptional regulator [Tomitella biformata]